MSTDITQLPLFQLHSVREQMEEEIKILTGSFGTLKTAQAKFATSLEAIGTLNQKNKDKKILVPLSGSLYVPGKLADVNSVIVDIGTGYYVEKDVVEAKDFYKRKVDFLKVNIEQLQETLHGKQNQYNILIDVIQQKMATEEKDASNSSALAKK